MPLVTLPGKIDISYELRGMPKGKPIVLVHGHGSRGSTFNDFIPFIEKDFYVLTFDLRGHGSSGKPVGKSYTESLSFYTITQFATDLRALVDAIHFPHPFSLLGHSVGGMIAQAFVLQHPEFVSNLILCSTTPYMYSEGRAMILQQVKDGVFKLTEDFFRSSCRMGLTRAFNKAHPEVVESSVKSRLLVAPDAYIGSMENFLLHFDTRSRLGEIRAPTLIIAGEQDAMLKNTYSQDLHQGIAGSKLVVIPKQNHGIFHEVPSLLAAEVENFVLKVS